VDWETPSRIAVDKGGCRSTDHHSLPEPGLPVLDRLLECEYTMAYKDILVYLDPTSDSENRLRLAITLASSHGARLIGVDACSEAAFESDWREQAVQLQESFDNALRPTGVNGVYLTAERRKRLGDHLWAHYADLIVTSQQEVPTKHLVVPGIPEQVLVTAGVPVLILPCGWRPRAIGENIVVAWKSSREATRAVHDAMPLLTKAKKVIAFTFAPEPDVLGNEPDSLVNHLRQHGVSAEASTWPNTAELSAVDALFACLDTQDADLIVAGAYGHSRLLEGLFGGVSHDLTRQPSLPVLMSH
jgi:nucleotide-binding universal stress UspA family protein